MCQRVIIVIKIIKIIASWHAISEQLVLWIYIPRELARGSSTQSDSYLFIHLISGKSTPWVVSKEASQQSYYLLQLLIVG